MWFLLLAFGLAVPAPGRAHPHIFIDAGLVLLHNRAGRLVAVEVTWRYDELYSLLIMQDYGLDPDFDGTLTQAERAATLGFDLNWGVGFEGGLELWQDGTPLMLGAPEPVSLRLTDSGQLETVHRRPVAGAIPMAPVIKAAIYDREFYIAFELTLPMRVVGRAGCAPRLVRPDLDAAYAILEAEIERLGGAISAEQNFPAVGAIFADQVVVTCAPA